jgi:phosphohistidine swiveling domain-containing protein
MLASCVDIEMRFVMRSDGAGRLEISYRVPYEATTLLDPADGVRAVPLPIARADFEAAIAGADGVRLRRFRRKDEEGEVLISARIDFDSVEALQTVAGFADLPVSFVASGGSGGEPDGVRAVPLPIARADFEAAIAGADGVRLRRFRRKDEEGEVLISARIDFDSVEALQTVAGFADLPVSFVASGGSGGELSQRVIPARSGEDAPDAAMIQLVQAVGGDSRVTFVVVAPARIKAADGATIDADGRTARYSQSLADYLTQPGPVDLTVRW